MRCRLTDGRTVVYVWHFKHTSKCIALLMQLQVETPSLELVVDGPDNRRRIVLVSDLNLDHEELRFLNPVDVA